MAHLPQSARMLRAWRNARDPRAVPGFTAKFGTRQRKGLTQAQVANLAGVTEGWYSKLERGVPEKYSDEFLECLVRVLNLDEAQRTHLFLEVTGRAPTPRPMPDPSSIDPALRDIVQSLPMPAYTFDSNWDVRIFNEAAAREFPFLYPGLNIMAWCLCFPEARIQLVNWEEDWAKPMASQLRIAARANPESKRLAQVIERIKNADKDARRILEEDVTAVTHPDGDKRRLFLPLRDEEIEVEFIALGRRRDTTGLMVIRPTDGYQLASEAIPSANSSMLAGTSDAPAAA